MGARSELRAPVSEPRRRVLSARRAGRKTSVAVAIVMALSVPAAGAPTAESSFDGWSLAGHALDGDGRAAAEWKASLDCDRVHGLISAYGEASPWETETPPPGSRLDAYFEDPDDVAYAGRVPHVEPSAYELDSVGVWAGTDAGEAFVACTRIHDTGWLPAGIGLVAVIEAAGSPVPEVTDGIADCDAGELLFVRAHFLYRPGSGWVFAPGESSGDRFGEFELTPGQTMEVVCGRIFDGGADAASFSELIPPVPVDLDPRVRGLAGLETWLWYDFERPGVEPIIGGSATVDALGTAWTIEARAWLDAVAWDMDCEFACSYRGPASGFDHSALGGPRIDFPDGPQRPAVRYDGGAGTSMGAGARHVYEEAGERTVSTVTFWRASYTWLGITYPHAPVVVAGERPYEVIGLRGVLSAPRG